MARIEKLREELAKTMESLDELNQADITTNETSVLLCGLWSKYWSLKMQIAEEESHSEHDKTRVKADHMIEVASRHLCEWERRKSAAWEKRRLDELPRIAKQIEEFRNAGNILGDLE